MNPEKALKEIQTLVEGMRNAYEQEYKCLFTFSNKFIKQLKEERAKLPYHLNLLDELHANENAHSRILLKLLQFTNLKGKYEIYQSLLVYINKRQKGLQNIRIKAPQMSQEEARIDLWVRDKKYAVIFENKINNACDQPEQLARYIEKTIEWGYEVKDIFVVYLSAEGHEPAEQSWGKYKEMFKDRYVKLSYRNDIYPWLKENILPEVRYKEIYLQTALVQYIDYLEGRFYLRETEKQMNMNLDKFIDKHWKLGELDKGEQVRILDEKIAELNEVLSKVQELRNRRRQEEEQEVVKSWKERAERDLEMQVLADYRPEALVALEIGTIEGKQVVAFIGRASGRMYCQVEFKNQNYEIPNNSKIMELKDALPDRNPHCIWKWMEERDYEETFKLFCDVVKRCIYINKEEKTK